VGQAGARRWLARYGSPTERQAYETYTRQRDEFLALTLATRNALAQVYASTRTEADKRREKQRLLTELRSRYQTLKQQWGGYSGYDSWFASDLNNAKLGSLHAYTRFAPAFELLLAEASQDFSAFYRAAESMARLPSEQRTACLEALLSGGVCASGRGTRLAGLP
jgi:predicted aminopeptidase